MKFTFTLIGLSLFFIIGSAFFFQTEDFPSVIIKKLRAYRENYTQEKIYIHFDRAQYFAGDEIWFKVYLVNAETQIGDTLRNLVYVNLIDGEGNLVNQRRIRVINGVGWGDLKLPEDIPSGTYSISSYTNWMLNFDKELLFDRKIRIYNDNFIRSEQDNKEFDFKVFPEGGHLVAGIPNTVAFECVSKDGKNLSIAGSLIDDRGNTILSFNDMHRGMGVFEFVPEPGNSYWAIVSTSGGPKVKYPMPQSEESGFTLQTDNSKVDFVDVKLNVSSGKIDGSSYLISVLSRGEIVYMANANFTSSNIEISIPKFRLPEGIARITIFDPEGIPSAERTIFVKKPKNYKLNITSDHKIYRFREKTDLTIQLGNLNGQPLKGKLSLSATDSLQNDINDPLSGNIYTQFYLSSELPGYIMDPDYYFDPANEDAGIALDLLMCTHGWVRYKWKKILTDDEITLTHAYESGVTLSGSVTNEKNRSLRRNLIFMVLGGDRSDFFSFYTDPQGRFEIPNMDITDSTQILLQVKDREKIYTNFLLDKNITRESVPLYSIISDYWAVNNTKDVQKLGKIRKQVDMAFNFDNVNVLEEVKISSSRIQQKDVREVGQLYSTPSTRYDSAYLGKYNNYINAFDFLRVKDPFITIRGNIYNPTVIIRNTEIPYVLVNGSPMSPASAASIPFANISTIDVIRSLREVTTMGKPFIAIYTKNGLATSMYSNLASLTYPGFSLVKEFYSPSYDPEKDPDPKPDFRATLYWEPDIEVDSTGIYHISFYNSDNSTTVDVVVEGFSDRGDVIRGVYHYKIK